MSQFRHDRCVGSIFGLALGDALGAPYEGGVLERLTWQAIGLSRPGTLRYTDDTEMAIGLAESLIACGGLDADHLAKTWAERASWDRGYGGGALKVLRMIRRGTPWQEANRKVFPDGSFGNGGAMRAAPIGLYYHDDPDALTRAARQASEITHAHELGIQGGVLIARATAVAMRTATGIELLDAIETEDLDEQYRDRLKIVRQWLQTDSPPPLPDVAHQLGNTILAHESAVTAVYLAARHCASDFESLITDVINLGGDVDTIGAMAGGIFGANRRVDALPRAPLDQLEDCDHIAQLAGRLASGAESPR
jgi:ADP-ribosylglycohydrolase